MNTKLKAEIASLESLKVSVLVDRYADLFGEQTGSRHKRYLVRRIAWKLQSNAEGGLSERARLRAMQLADDAEIRVTAPRQHPVNEHCHLNSSKHQPARDRRLPSPGCWIERNYKGRLIRVLVDDDGFEYDGRRFRSLSAIAKSITGSHINGFLFFQLGGKS